jgi:hypothetical protein
MSDKKHYRNATTPKDLAMARLEALEPEEGRIGEPAQEVVKFIRVSDDFPEKLPWVVTSPQGHTLVVHGREIPEEYAEEYLAQYPGDRFE